MNKAQKPGFCLFEGVSPATVSPVLASAEKRVLAQGQRLLGPGEINHDLFLVESGQLGVYADSAIELLLATIQPGDCAGELSVLEGEATSAAVIAMEPTEVVIIKSEQLWSLMAQSPVIAYNLLRTLGQRLRQDHVALRASLEGRQALEEAATTDPLTGLLNRRGMSDLFERELARVHRDGHSAAMFMLDIDYFKRINDSLGHRAGDLVLVHLAQNMRRCLRPSDLVARFGGEEFCVLLPGVDPGSVEDAALRLHRALGDMDESTRRSPVSYTVSIGATHSLSGDHINAMVERADAALYLAKQQGRNRIRVAAAS
ncbi:MAG: GGDEF domain-containing protein [Gammaproteobacteria bacterium]|nr:GGDEF domain-containing protein [Gammaproteobacteria bacterium]